MSVLLRLGPSAIHGLGVFTARNVEVGTLLEVCPVILIPSEQLKLIDQTAIFDYYYSWPTGEGALALGFGSLYNHSASANASYRMNTETRTIEILADRDVRAGEELTISYGGEGDRGLWFDPVQPPTGDKPVPNGL